MNLFWLLFIVLIVLAVGGVPRAGGPGWYGASAGIYPTSIFGIIALVLVILLLLKIL